MKIKRFCPNCGAETTSKFCPYCGTRLEDGVEPTFDSSETVSTTVQTENGKHSGKRHLKLSSDELRLKLWTYLPAVLAVIFPILMLILAAVPQVWYADTKLSLYGFLSFNESKVLVVPIIVSAVTGFLIGAFYLFKTFKGKGTIGKAIACICLIYVVQIGVAYLIACGNFGEPFLQPVAVIKFIFAGLFILTTVVALVMQTAVKKKISNAEIACAAPAVAAASAVGNTAKSSSEIINGNNIGKNKFISFIRTFKLEVIILALFLIVVLVGSVVPPTVMPGITLNKVFDASTNVSIGMSKLDVKSILGSPDIVKGGEHIWVDTAYKKKYDKLKEMDKKNESEDVDIEDWDDLENAFEEDTLYEKLEEELKNYKHRRLTVYFVDGKVNSVQYNVSYIDSNRQQKKTISNAVQHSAKYFASGVVNFEISEQYSDGSFMRQYWGVMETQLSENLNQDGKYKYKAYSEWGEFEIYLTVDNIIDQFGQKVELH